MKLYVIFFMFITQSFCVGMEYASDELFSIKKYIFDENHFVEIKKCITKMEEGSEGGQMQELLGLVKSNIREAGKKAYTELVLKEEATKWVATRGEFQKRKFLLSLNDGDKKEEATELLDKLSNNIGYLDEGLQKFYEQALNSLWLQLSNNRASYVYDVITNHLNGLSEIPVSVISAINEYQDIGKINIIQSEAKTCFADFSKTKNFSIRINPKDIENGPIISTLDGLNENGNYILRKNSADLFTILAHELIHVWHFIENKEQFMADSRQDSPGYWNLSIWKEKPGEFNRLWQDAEEQRTVIGIQNKVDICELTIRYSEKLPVRYPYLVVGDIEVEKDIISAIFENYKLDSHNKI